MRRVANPARGVKTCGKAFVLPRIYPRADMSTQNQKPRRRFRAPTAKPGELVMKWGKMPHDKQEVCYAWGDGVTKADVHLLHNAVAGNWPDPFSEPLFSNMLPSLLEGLDARGYDLTTIRFSIRKKEER